MLVVNGSQVYGIPQDLYQTLNNQVEAGDDQAVHWVLNQHGLEGAPNITDAHPQSYPMRALSLAVAQKCNLGCTYCYAQDGSFGAPARTMSWDVAKASIERLLEQAQPGDRANLAFLGGEPLLNRQVLRAATKFALQRATAKGVKMGFSITTNGTLITK